jgi:hypothetical protein
VAAANEIWSSTGGRIDMNRQPASARYIGSGFVLWIGGSIVATIAFITPSQSLFSAPQTSPWVVVGCIAALVGMGAMAIGIYRLACAIDAMAARLTSSADS